MSRLRSQPRAGIYAHDRYERGLRAYRRRIRRPLLIVVAPPLLFFLVIAGSRKLDAWSVAAGGLAAVGVAFTMFIRDEPPQHVLNWKRGADGERKTEKALQPLEREGWTVEHDIQRDGRANLDHVVKGPNSVFLLETKNLSGTITFDNGVLTARQFDDPDEVYRYVSLAPRVRGQAIELSRSLGAETGRQPWVHAVVVVWGHFEPAVVERENVAYVGGNQLVPWLRSRTARRGDTGRSA